MLLVCTGWAQWCTWSSHGWLRLSTLHATACPPARPCRVPGVHRQGGGLCVHVNEQLWAADDWWPELAASRRQVGSTHRGCAPCPLRRLVQRRHAVLLHTPTCSLPSLLHPSVS